MKLIECPRDAMQGIETFIPTETKLEYMQSLLNVGFDTIDFGSFVSPKAIPQMADTEEIIQELDLSNTKTKLLAIVANMRGVEKALNFKKVDFLGYPFSISETFQIRNTKKTIDDSIDLLRETVNLCDPGKLVVYLSMGFGNPYGDDWSIDILEKYAGIVADIGVKTISIADTVGNANKEKVEEIFTHLSQKLEGIDFGLHLHSNPALAAEKIKSAYSSGCKRIDSAINGFGGCPFAKDELVGNLATETVIAVLEEMEVKINIDEFAFQKSLDLAAKIFLKY